MIKKLLAKFTKEDFISITEFTHKQYKKAAKSEHVILRFIIGMEVFMLIFGYFNYNHQNPLMKVYMSLYAILALASLGTDLVLSAAEKNPALYDRKRLSLVGYGYHTLIVAWGCTITTYDVRHGGGSYWVAATVMMAVSVFLNLNPIHSTAVVVSAGAYLCYLSCDTNGGFSTGMMNIIIFILIDVTVIMKNYFTLYNNMYMENKLKELSMRDGLTGLHNRRALEEKIVEDDFEGIKSVAIIDIDDFKVINDTGGHENGDNALLRVTALFREYFSDKELIRYGGDEFLILSSFDDKETLERLKKVNRRLSRVPGDVPIHISGGIAVPEPMVAITDTIKMADALLYDAKRKGKGRFFTSK
ncbi:MAG: GGDEF domain-containing protein [Lachnospiraceae bacterium]|nr:GGDEF domain-containing protein [Lachnospiraceae bacterium]